MKAARENLEERRLAGAVLADDRVCFAARDRERHVTQRRDGREGLIDVIELDGVAHPLKRFGARPAGPGRQTKRPPASGCSARSRSFKSMAAVVMKRSRRSAPPKAHEVGQEVATFTTVS